MDLNWLRDFESLARTLNFTRAADERNITQSAFSRRIKALESWVGLPLVNRATYPIQITEAGKQLLPVALGTVALLSDTRQAIRDGEVDDNSFLRISSLHTISVNYLAKRIEEQQCLVEELRVRVISDSLSTCCDLLIDGAVDIMLCYYHQSVSPRIDTAAFERKDLLADPLIPVASKGAALEGGWNIGADGQDPIPYLAYDRSSFLGLVVEHTVGQRHLNADTIYVDGLVETIKRRLLTGAGFAWMPESAIASELAQGQLVPVGDESWIAPLKIAALANPETFDKQSKEFWEFL